MGHSSLSNVEVKNELNDLYFHSASMPSWHAWGQLYVHFVLYRILLSESVFGNYSVPVGSIDQQAGRSSDALFWGPGGRGWRPIV